MEIKTVHKGGNAEIIEKKSRFIGEVFPVKSEEEAMEILEQVKKKYWDREFDTLDFKKPPQSLEIGVFFCQFFCFYTCSFVLFVV